MTAARPPHAPDSGPAVARGQLARFGGPLARLGGVLERRPWHIALAAAAGGLTLGGAGWALLPVAGASLPHTGAAIGCLVVASLTACRAPRVALVAAACLLAGVAVGAQRVEAIAAPGAALEPGDRIAGRATIERPPQPGEFGSSVEVRMHTGAGRGARLLARLTRDQALPGTVSPGAEVRVRGSFRRAHRSKGSDFDFAAYLRRRGVAGEVAVLAIEPTGYRRGGLRGAIDGARDRATAAVRSGLDAPAAALATGMVLGQDEQIAREVKDDFQASGLSHVLAVSGQNVMLLAALALPLLTLAGAGPRARLFGTIALIAVYVPLAGAGASLQRAGVMGAAGLLALALDRPASRWYVLLLAAVATLALNPLVVGDPGWQLSFAAVAGILVLAPPIRAAMPGVPRPLAEGVATTLSASVATGPLIGHHFGTVSLAGLPANIAALPLVAPIMWLGMLRGALGQLAALDPLGALAQPALDLLGLALAPLLGALGHIASAFAQVPGGNPTLPLGSRASVALAYGVLAASAAGVARIARRIDPAPARARWRRSPRRTRLATLGVLAAALALGIARLLAPGAPPDRLTVSYLDIGQGDSTLIQAPGGIAVLFDGGPPEGRVTRLLRRAGVRRLAIVVSTHQSRDHHGGLQAVAEQVPISTLVQNGDGTRDRSYWRMVDTARERGARVIAPAPGQTLVAGPLRIRIFGPPPRPPGPPPEDPNPRAIAAVVSDGSFDLFLSGDAESDALARYPDLPQVEAMKVSHHGSADEGLPALLQRLQPRIAGIEVGADNTYGHPAAPTLAALRRAGVQTYRTDRDGTVRLTIDGDGSMHVERNAL